MSPDHKQYIKKNKITKKFLKNAQAKDIRKSQRVRKESIQKALQDALTIDNTLSTQDLLTIARDVDRVVNSERMRNGPRTNETKSSYRRGVYLPPSIFQQLGIYPGDYEVADISIANNSKPFTNGAYLYMIKKIRKQIKELLSS